MTECHGFRVPTVLTADAKLDLRARLPAEVDGDLAPYQGRIAAVELRATRRRAVIDRLRKRLGLPRF